MPTDFESSQTAKSLKVLSALRTLAAEYETEGDIHTADTIRVHAMHLPLTSLARLYDMLTREPIPA